MAQHFTVLFVCTGNVCRSPLAAGLLRERLHERLGRQYRAVTVSSAGVEANPGDPLDEQTVRQFGRLGITPGVFKARHLTPRMVDYADLVLTATKQQRSRVLLDSPKALRRTFTIREFAALVAGVELDSPVILVADAAHLRSTADLQDYDVPDPRGASATVHRRVADMIAWSVTPIAAALATAVAQSSSAGVRPAVSGR